jgi:hypothetical protein
MAVPYCPKDLASQRVMAIGVPIARADATPIILTGMTAMLASACVVSDGAALGLLSSAYDGDVRVVNVRAPAKRVGKNLDMFFLRLFGLTTTT